MKCQICNENDANIIFTKIVNNEKITINMCAVCAKEQGLSLKITTEMNPQPQHEHTPDIFDFDRNDTVKYPEISCMLCGLTYKEFKKSGLFGCDRCVESFGNNIDDMLKQIHGSFIHEGKAPLNISDDIQIKKHIQSLRLRLKRCIESEEYERAAELRDKIASFEDKI